MNRKRLAVGLCSLALSLSVVAACGSSAETATPAATPTGAMTDAMTDKPDASMTEKMTEKPSESMTEAMTEKPDAMAPGAYVTKAEYEAAMTTFQAGKVVLFFHASWCPDCKKTDESLKTDGVPKGLTIVKLDYDTETDLKQKYGITQQHTFVQIDKQGAQLAKWAGTFSGADIGAKTKA